MRTIQTFILRLLIDPDEPGTLRGALQLVPEGDSRPFVGERELLAVLHRLVTPIDDTTSAGKRTDEMA